MTNRLGWYSQRKAGLDVVVPQKHQAFGPDGHSAFLYSRSRPHEGLWRLALHTRQKRPRGSSLQQSDKALMVSSATFLARRASWPAFLAVFEE
jgi:hypothetical protein